VTKTGARFDAFVPGPHVIEAYGAGGFRFAGMSHIGSILATPKGIGAIAPTTLAELDADDFQRLFDELAAEPRSVEFVVIGAGPKIALTPRPVADLLRGKSLRFETMATGPASRVYNIMVEERRRVAALLLAAP
jgi:uncharacterized protein